MIKVTGYPPGEGPGIALDDLPRLDAVVVSHGHYDHYDMEAFSAYPDHEVPVFVKRGTEAAALRAGFAHVTPMDWWQDAQIAGVRIVAAPAKHGVPENTYVFVTASGVVYFAGDTLLIPELDEIGVRFPTIDLMLVATNGLRVKPMFNRKMVMDANDAAQLSARLHPKVVIPMHYAFEARDWFHDTFVIAYERGPQHFVDACHRLAPDVEVIVASPGRQVVLNGSSRSRSIGSIENSQDA